VTRGANLNPSLRMLCAVLIVASAAGLSACGGSATPSAAPGSPENPLVAKPTESVPGAGSIESQPGSSEEPGYEALVKRQAGGSRSRFTPCNLVTRAQAQAILGATVEAPVEAPQGPTCIFRSPSANTFITLAVQSSDLDSLKGQVRRRQEVTVSDRKAYCGTTGQPMLYVELSRRRILTVGAPCSLARQFAARAVATLDG
jgi:hypothetical protein